MESAMEKNKQGRKVELHVARWVAILNKVDREIL